MIKAGVQVGCQCFKVSKKCLTNLTLALFIRTFLVFSIRTFFLAFPGFFLSPYLCLFESSPYLYPTLINKYKTVHIPNCLKVAFQTDPFHRKINFITVFQSDEDTSSVQEIVIAPKTFVPVFASLNQSITSALVQKRDEMRKILLYAVTHYYKIKNVHHRP